MKGLCGCRGLADGIVPVTDNGDDPTCLQKIKHEGSVLSLAVSDEYIFAGTQRKNILVWDIHTYERKAILKGHQGSVLCLHLSEDKKLLFSSAGDAIVKVRALFTPGIKVDTHRYGMQSH
jgi:di- and tripeptidase